MPLTPSGRIHFGIELTVEKDNARVASPRAAKKNDAHVRISRNLAAIKHIAAALVRIVLALRGQVNDLVRNSVDLTMVEDSQRVAEDEVYVAFDITIFKVLPCRDTGSRQRR